MRQRDGLGSGARADVSKISKAFLLMSAPSSRFGVLSWQSI